VLSDSLDDYSVLMVFYRGSSQISQAGRRERLSKEHFGQVHLSRLLLLGILSGSDDIIIL
jgi:hypothetical protein